MAIVITDDKHYANIAAAIRAKHGEETTYKPSEMAAAILAISGGVPKTITEMNVFEYAGMCTVTYSDGTMATVSGTFDENGNATGLSDDAGNTVNFTSGYPTSATDKDGNTVAIVWG